MNYPTENKQPDAQPSQRELIEQAVSSLAMEMIQLRRTLWLVLTQTGPLEVKEEDAHPLWRMKGTRTPDGNLRLEASMLPEPTKEQLAELAEKLNGSMSELMEAMEKTDLKDHPPAYVQMRLQSRVVRDDNGYWVDAKIAKIVTLPPSDNN